jgi:glycosyltransferase involved in cell wall biosynthesis
MKIAYLTNVLTNHQGVGDSVHVTKVAENLLLNNNILYTNLQKESERFIKFNKNEFSKRGKEIEVFYIRICGNPKNDELTYYRLTNMHAPCVWEVNSPLEELRTSGEKESKLNAYNKRRKKLATMVDAAICVSKEMEEYAKAYLKIKNTFLIPNGSDHYLFSPKNRENNSYNKNQFAVIWVGSAQYPWQGIKIVKEVSNRMVNIDNSIKFYVTDNGMNTENLHFLGKVLYLDMPKIMASADLGLCIYEDSIYKLINFKSKFYGSPLKLFDYMASGLPVIGSNFGQIKDILEEYKNGLVTDNSINDIVDKIIFCKNNRKLMLEMALKGRQAIKEKFNWSIIVSKSEEIFKILINNRSKNNFSNNNCKKLVERLIKKISKIIWMLK